ncbi:MAG: hypothetical protein H6739_08275 [Alphaproteobacteria bacterium]|nr:hypothetical protein [Alphaproteobacteria bacterium]
MLINSAGSEAGMDDLVDGVTLRVLQDTTQDHVTSDYGAEKWYFYFMDREGKVRFIHYKLSFPSDTDRFLGLIDAVKEGR